MTRTPSALPVPYKDAKRALAALVRVDDVKKIRDKAVALEVYAYQAKDGQLAADAVEYKRRATRRLGELMRDMRKADKLAKPGERGGKKRKIDGVRKTPSNRSPTLNEQNIDKNLAKRAREEAAKAD